MRAAARAPGALAKRRRSKFENQAEASHKRRSHIQAAVSKAEQAKREVIEASAGNREQAVAALRAALVEFRSVVRAGLIEDGFERETAMKIVDDIVAKIMAELDPGA